VAWHNCTGTGRAHVEDENEEEEIARNSWSFEGTPGRRSTRREKRMEKTTWESSATPSFKFFWFYIRAMAEPGRL
jgi:hypothetical protein